MLEVLNKLKFKDTGVIFNAPADLADEFSKLGCATSFNRHVKATNTLVFINDKKEFISFLSRQLDKVVPDSVLWFAYPKGTSKIKTDVNRDKIRDLAETYGITTVTAISIDDTWSALRFRPIEKVGQK